MSTIDDYAVLFSAYCPIIFFHKDEPFMPCNFEEIINRSVIRGKDNVLLADIDTLNYVKNNWDKNTIELIDIVESKKNVTPEESRKIGNTIICKTNGVYTYNNIDYLDLVYIVTFTWNGTKEPHPFDKEEVVIRLYKPSNSNESYKVKRVFGSAHGNGMWYDVIEDRFRKGFVRLVTTTGTNYKRPVMFSALESHAMYQHARINKRIFNFGNDVSGMDIRWEPNQFLVMYNDTINLYSEETKKLELINGLDLSYYKYDKLIGGIKKNQKWISNKPYDTINLDGYYKLDGGMTNLFTGRYTKVDNRTRVMIFTVAISIWLLFFSNLILKDYVQYTGKFISGEIFILNSVIHIILTVLLLVVGTYIGLEYLILNGPDLL